MLMIGNDGARMAVRRGGRGSGAGVTGLLISGPFHPETVAPTEDSVMPHYRSRTSTHGRNMAGARGLWRATGM